MDEREDDAPVEMDEERLGLLTFFATLRSGVDVEGQHEPLTSVEAGVKAVFSVEGSSAGKAYPEPLS